MFVQASSVRPSVMYFQTEKTVVAFLIVLAICQDFRVSSLDVHRAQKQTQNIPTPNNDSDLRDISDNGDEYPTCNRPKRAQGRIATVTGGRYAFYGQFPWMANVRHIFGHGRHGVCGGTIISSRWILTAAHCLVKQPRNFMVILGTVKTVGIHLGGYSGDGLAVLSSNVVIHHGYRVGFDQNDIGLIRTPQKIPYSNVIRPIQMAGRTEERHDFVGKTAMVFGWGRELPLRSDSLSKTLKYTSLPIISNDECAQTFGGIEPSHVCTSSRFGRDVCPGDSGGPLVIEIAGRYVQLGVTSAGSDPCASGQPAIFTRVSSFRDWIRNVVEALG